MCPHPTLSTQEVCRNPRVTLVLLSDPLGPPRARAGITYQISTEGLLDARMPGPVLGPKSHQRSVRGVYFLLEDADKTP